MNVVSTVKFAEPAISTAVPSTVREVNRAVILNLIRLHQPISRAALSKKTGIFRSNVSDIVEELIAAGFLIEKPAEPTGGRGRAPILLSLNDAGLHVLGVSVRATRAQVALAGLSGEIEDTASFETPKRPEKFPERLLASAQKLRLRHPEVSSGPFEAFGLSVPGEVNSTTGEIRWLPTLPAWSDFPLAKEIEGHCGGRAQIENDCNLGALAEMCLREPEVANATDFIFLEIGCFGVGGGIVINRELYRGFDSTSVAEFGHMIITAGGPKCTCGRRGCWERLVCDEATWRQYKPEVPFSISGFQALLEAALQGDRCALNAVRHTFRYFWLGVSNIVTAFNPQSVIVSGEITRVWDLLQEAFAEAGVPDSIQRIVSPARLWPEQLFLRGAVYLALSGVFARPKIGW